VIGILLLLAALGVTAVLAFILLAAVRARLRERAEAERAVKPEPPAAPPVRIAIPGQPEQPAPPPPPPAAGPKKPAFTPWAVASGIIVVLVTLMGGLILKSCEAIGARALEQRRQQECWNSLTALAQWFENDWETRKALPPADMVPVSMAICPEGNRFKSLGGRKLLLGNARVLVVETEPHRNAGVRHAVVVEQKFLDAGKTVAEYQSAGGAPTPRSYPVGPGGYRAYYGRGYFQLMQLSEAQYETIRKDVERD
jgi:hypothetical protein